MLLEPVAQAGRTSSSGAASHPFIPLGLEELACLFVHLSVGFLLPRLQNRQTIVVLDGGGRLAPDATSL